MPLTSEFMKEYWKKISPEERSFRMSEIAKARHKKLSKSARRTNAFIMVEVRMKKQKELKDKISKAIKRGEIDGNNLLLKDEESK
jgi:predicted DNA-binding protein